MILYLFIWFVSSIIISLLLARMIGKGNRMILNEEDSFVSGDWFLKNTLGQQTYWDSNEYKVLTELDADYHVRKRDSMKVSLN